MDPTPVGRDLVVVDEKAAKEEEIGEECADHGVSERYLGEHTRDECDEGAPNPEGGKHDEEAEGEVTAKAHCEERDGGEGQGVVD